jgi:hypothetical protein
MINWELRLDDLPNQKLSDESAAIFKAGNIFSTSVAGVQVQFKLRTGRDQMKLIKQLSKIKLQNGHSEGEAKALLGLLSRITSIEGVAAQDRLAWLEELDLHDIKTLAKQMDRLDCGVNTTVEIICSGDDGCGLQQEVELPLDGKFFKDMLT